MWISVKFVRVKFLQTDKVSLTLRVVSKLVTSSNSALAIQQAWGADVLDENGRAVPIIMDVTVSVLAVSPFSSDGATRPSLC